MMLGFETYTFRSQRHLYATQSGGDHDNHYLQQIINAFCALHRDKKY